MSVTPNVFVLANKAKKAIYCYCNAFGGEFHATLPFRSKRTRTLCVVIESPLLNLHNSNNIIAAKNFAERNECNMLRDVGENPLRPGVMVATVTDPFKFVWQLSNSAGINKDGFLCFEDIEIVVIGGDAEMFERFDKECREDVVVVVAYELSKVAIHKCLKYSKNSPGLCLFFPKIYEDMNFKNGLAKDAGKMWL
ncbi:uncharacterized protein Pyn_14537 [Prunus yedoensis var. nudiflora]|uniref:Uncharacterized protein n=1 Tax=Prunus yedoensis var. nudiflora TaxID=2094558 RepID=A0A314Y268_PRUYE|nr:uncharacterized protein Pyn_14537 [Prunus yedoensis var. nudiflora]